MSINKIKLNLGCGDIVVPGWINVDYALGARLAKMPLLGRAARGIGLIKMKWDPQIYLHNLTKALPWATASVDAVYCSHTLEHMSREQGLSFLKECVRILKPGGILRFVVPGLKPIIQRYLDGILPAEHFLEHLHVLYSNYDSKFKSSLAPFVQFPHKCMYDPAALIRAIASAGLVAAERSGFDSEISDIQAIELQNRVVDAAIAEGRKA